MRTNVAVLLLLTLAGCTANAPAQPSAQDHAAAPAAMPAPAPRPSAKPIQSAAPPAHHAGIPADVVQLSDRIEACDHFSGEDPYDADRAAFLRKQVEATCPGNDATLQRLRAKYAGDVAILKKLSALAAGGD